MELKRQSKNRRRDLIKKFYYEENESLTEVGKHFGIGKARVAQLMKRWGFPRAQRRQRKLDKELTKIGHLEQLEIGVEYERGAIIGKIMAGHELTHLAVCEILKRQGIKFSSSLSRKINLRFSHSRQFDICRKYKEGFLLSTLAEDYGVSAQDIDKILRFHKVGRQSRGEWWEHLKKGEKEKWVKKAWGAANKRPNKAESKLYKILQSILSGEYALNVRGDALILGGKVPDFANVNGQKKVIELFGDYFHRNDNPQDRINYFKKFGYNTLVIWEHELQDKPSLFQKLAEFNGSPLPEGFSPPQKQLQFSFIQEAHLE